MNMGQVKQYILAILRANQDMLLTAPELIIDHLFNSMDIDTVLSISQYPASKSQYQDVWDRYLLPRLCSADQYAKVFDLQGRM